MINMFNLVRTKNFVQLKAEIDQIKKKANDDEEIITALSIKENGKTLLHVAVEENLVTMVDFLINAGVPINIYDDNNKTPLHLAVEKGHFEVIQTLLARDADLKKVDGENKTPLMKAEEKILVA